MKLKDVQNLQAGPELDRLVAVALGIDLEAECDGDMYNEDDQSWSCTKCALTGNWGDESYVNHKIHPYPYSKVGTWAFAAFKQLTHQGHFASLEAHGDRDSISGNWGWRVGVQISERIIDYVYADNAELAIAHAVVYATG